MSTPSKAKADHAFTYGFRGMRRTLPPPNKQTAPRRFLLRWGVFFVGECKLLPAAFERSSSVSVHEETSDSEEKRIADHLIRSPSFENLVGQPTKRASESRIDTASSVCRRARRRNIRPLVLRVRSDRCVHTRPRMGSCRQDLDRRSGFMTKSTLAQLQAGAAS